MKTRWIAALAIVLLIIFGIWPRPRTTPEVQPAGSPLESVKTATAPIPATASGVATNSPDPAATKNPAPNPSVSLPPAPALSPIPPEQLPIEQIREDMDRVQFALRDYRTVLGENPIGTNAEITKALTGDNLKQVKIPVPPGSSLNGEGEMCDRWGTPYFFHQISGKQMEIHSAGPDLKMGTKDDLLVK